MREGTSIRDRIRRVWEAWLVLPYPTAEFRPGSTDGEIDGVDLALLDGDAASVVAWYLDPIGTGRVDPRVADVTRQHALADLEEVVPHLSGTGQAYFGPLLALLRLVDQAIKSERPQK